jgi:hypothetical protein
MRHRLSSEAMQTTSLIADLNRIVQIVSSGIEEEEQETGISDPALPDYPTTARELMARRDNLLRTIAELEQRLDELRQLA